MSARAAAALLALACLLAAGCQSVPRDVVVETPGEREIAGLDVYGVRLAELSLAPDAASLAALRAELDTVAASPGFEPAPVGARGRHALGSGAPGRRRRPGPHARRARRFPRRRRGGRLARARGARA